MVFAFGLHTEGTEQPSMGFSLLESKYAAARSSGFGQEVLRRILSGTSVLSSDRFHTHYEAATKIRALLSKQMRHALDGVDVLLTPTCLSMPSTTMAYTDPTEMFANDVLTVPVSLALSTCHVEFRGGQNPINQLVFRLWGVQMTR
jgi:aspartyl-tRNA(Asn)/glutamyl-tRNA(Gln) amidotransferase subunit A